jgi:hypothetical protein
VENPRAITIEAVPVATTKLTLTGFDIDTNRDREQAPTDLGQAPEQPTATGHYPQCTTFQISNPEILKLF